MKNPFRCDIKGTSSAISGIDPVNNSLPMCILIVIHFTICITKGIPILAYSEIRITCIQVVLDITTPESSNKIKPPSIIPNFFSAGQKVLHLNLWCNTFSHKYNLSTIKYEAELHTVVGLIS